MWRPDAVDHNASGGRAVAPTTPTLSRGSLPEVPGTASVGRAVALRVPSDYADAQAFDDDFLAAQVHLDGIVGVVLGLEDDSAP